MYHWWKLLAMWQNILEFSSVLSPLFFKQKVKTSCIFISRFALYNSEYQTKAHSAGFEPAARSLEGCCSILSELRMREAFRKKRDSNLTTRKYQIVFPLCFNLVYILFAFFSVTNLFNQLIYLHHHFVYKMKEMK